MLGVKSFHESFYGTPKPAEAGRRGKKRQPKAKEEPENEIAVVGVHYRSFDDDSMAAFVNSPAAQVPWNGDKNLLIDRYDVRHLLQDLSGIRRRRRPASPSLDVSREELDYERYRDLEGLENPSPASEDDAYKYENDSGGHYQRVGFNYSNGGDQAAQGGSGDRSTEETAFSPSFSVPEHLLTKLPASLKGHQIMAGTAKYVIEHGGQAEIVLRVKQAANPTFGFLMPDHYHHEYFRFLVDNPQLVGIGLSVEPVAAVEVLSEEAEGGLSLLGTAYGDSDEEAEVDTVTDAKLNQPEVENSGYVGKGGDVSEERSGGTDDGNHGKNSLTSDHQTGVSSENGTCDAGDFAEASKAIEVLRNEIQDNDGSGVGEASGSGNADSVARLLEPLPPGTETSEPMEVEYEASDVPATYSEQGLPPYKEPPIQQRRIIDKMVEFISRNGKEFEAIVRERDKKDGRFQFLLPWNEFYPYFSQSLEVARQVNASPVASETGATPTHKSEVPPSEERSEDKPANDNFLKGVPYGDEFSVPDTSAHKDEVGMYDVEDNRPEASYDELGVMGFDAVMAAVRAATRGFPRTVEGNQLSAPQPEGTERAEPPPVGSDDAVMAAIKAATGASRRSKVEDPSAGMKGEFAQSRGSAGLGGGTDPTSLHAEEEKNLSGSGPPVSNLGFSPASQGDAVVAGKVAAKAAALAAGQEGDSADALLSPAGKRKAERLKRAKLFAAMLREGKGAIVQSGQGSGSHGVSTTPSVEKFSQAGVSMDVNPKDVSDKGNNVQEATTSAVQNGVKGSPEIRERASDALMVQGGAEEDTQNTTEGKKEQKPKEKSKEASEKHRKHYKKRKSHHDGEDKRKEGKDDSDTEQMRDRRHDRYDDEKRNDRRRDRDEVKLRNGHIAKGRVDEDRYLYDLEERGDSRKDRKYRHDTECKRTSRPRYDNEEAWHEDRHGYDVDGKDKSSRHRRRHGLEEGRLKCRHQNSDEKRKDSVHEHEGEEKLKERRHSKSPEERRDHRHGSPEKCKDRRHSHGKRKKHKDRDVSDGEDDSYGKHTHRKSRRHRREAEKEKSSIPRVETPDDKVQRDQGKGKQHEVVDQLQVDGPPVSAVKEPPPSAVDVPDDIRAKVRAMLAGISR